MNSTIQLDALIKKAVEENMPALALTDQGNLFAAFKFYDACIEAGIKPIIGAQVYVAPDDYDKEECEDHDVVDELILLCRNNDGWQNLVSLINASHIEGNNAKPRIDQTILQKYSNGLIALSAGSKGAVGRLLSSGEVDKAKDIALQLAKFFKDYTTGEHGFYLELNRHGLPNEENLILETVNLAQEISLPMVASNNVHFLTPHEHKAHEILRCIGSGQTILDVQRGPYNDQFHFSSASEMLDTFSDIPVAVENSLIIAQQCNLELDFRITEIPNFQTPKGENVNTWLQHQSEKGLEGRLAKNVLLRFHDNEKDMVRKQYKDRLAYELEQIQKTGYAHYFLIVSDCIRWAINEKIPVGQGRDSGVGSLVAWALDITGVDPIHNKLFFELFLDLKRRPDPFFQVDICIERRGEVVNYLQDKYGTESVSPPIKFKTLQANLVVREVGRVLQLPYRQVDSIVNLIPNSECTFLKNILGTNEPLQKLLMEDQVIVELMELSLSLEGLPYSTGPNSESVVMSRWPMTEMVPFYIEPVFKTLAVQIDIDDMMRLGHKKLDLVGMKTLTVVHEIIRKVNSVGAKHDAVALSIDDIPLDNKEVLKVVQKDHAEGTFALDPFEGIDILEKYAPNSFEDLVALAALCRPGPLYSGMLDDYVNKRDGCTPITYLHPLLEPTLKDTNGVIIFPEQIMMIAKNIAGYSTEGAILVLDAMRKRKMREIDSQRNLFVNGASEKNIDLKVAINIFDLMCKYAGYTMAKSYAIALAMDVYQPAWLNTHYQNEFIAASLSYTADNTCKSKNFISNAANDNATVSDNMQKYQSLQQPQEQEKIKSFSDMKSVLMDVVSIIENRMSEGHRYKVIPTGFLFLDKLMGGLRPSELTVLTGIQGVGKKYLAMDIAFNLSLNQKVPVGLFSYDMPKEQWGFWILAKESRVAPRAFRTGSFESVEYAKLVEASVTVSQQQIFIDDQKPKSIADLRKRARLMKISQNIRVIILDYIQILQSVNSDGSYSAEESKQVIHELKDMAKELDIPVIAIFQIQQTLQSSSDVNSSNVEYPHNFQRTVQDADVVMLLRRNNECSVDKQGSRLNAEVEITKNGYGATGTIELSFEEQFKSFNGYS